MGETVRAVFGETDKVGPTCRFGKFEIRRKPLSFDGGGLDLSTE